MTTPSESSLVAVLVERIDNLVRSVDGMQQSLNEQAGRFVPRTEWLLRNDQVDREFKSKGAEIAELRTEIRAGRHPWPVWLAGAASVVAIAAGFDLI